LIPSHLAQKGVQLSVAALAVAFRSYVTSLTRTKTREACNRVTEIYHRWQSAEKYLSPTIDFLPQLLIISILLFVAGLVDSLFSISASLDGWASHSLFTASKVCSVVFGTVVFILACAIIHATFRPLHSPFASTLTDLIHRGYLWSFQYLLYPLLNTLYERFSFISPEGYVWHILRRITNHIDDLQSYRNVSAIQRHHATAYHNIMSQTYDDSLLDDGMSVLKAMMESIPSPRFESFGRKSSAESMIGLLDYLFSPAASRRSGITAAVAIIDYKPFVPGKQ
jgi:hypothetical protein